MNMTRSIHLLNPTQQKVKKADTHRKNNSGLSEKSVLSLVDPNKLYGQKGQNTMGIITDIFYGDTDMQDAFCKSEEYRQALKNLIEADNALRKSLSANQIALLDAAKECGNRLNEIITANSFANGFRFGARLMLEVLLLDEE